MRVLVFVGCYTPGFKAGGPIRTITNLVEWFGDEFRFQVLTADRDLGDTEPFSSITLGQWQQVGKAQVRYLSPRELRMFAWPRLLKSVSYDVLYMNSFFFGPTRRVLWLRRFGLIPNKPLIVAPRGEFSPGALELKWQKKAMYLRLAKVAGLCRNLLWQAASKLEAEHIRAVFGNDISVFVAPNLPTKSRPMTQIPRTKTPGRARLVFLSRVARKKNVDYALNLLASARGEVDFDIYGPIEDVAYWKECETLISRLPPNVRVAAKGVIAPDDILDSLAQYDLMLMPTRGENFGHAILEAMRAGCPVLISDQTPWRHLPEEFAGWDLPLAEPQVFREKLQFVIDMDQDEFSRWSQGARGVGERFVSNLGVLSATRQLFFEALKQGPSR